MAQRRQIGHQEKNEFFLFLNGNLKQEDGKLRIPCPFLGRGEWVLTLRNCIATFNESSEPRTQNWQSLIFVDCNLVAPYERMGSTWIDSFKRGERRALFEASFPRLVNSEVIDVRSNIEFTLVRKNVFTGEKIPLKKDIDVFMSISLQRCT